MEAETLTMPEIARELYITRKDVYNILAKKENQDIFEIVVIADKKRITRESFERWYVGQSNTGNCRTGHPRNYTKSGWRKRKRKRPALRSIRTSPVTTCVKPQFLWTSLLMRSGS